MKWSWLTYVIAANSKFDDTEAVVAPLPALLGRQFQHLLNAGILGAIPGMLSPLACRAGPLVALDTDSHVFDLVDKPWRHERGALWVVAVHLTGCLQLHLFGLKPAYQVRGQKDAILV